MIGYGDDDGDYDDKDSFRMNIISALLSNSKSWEWGRVKIPWIVFGWNYSLVNYLPWMLPDSAFTATPHCCWNIALLLKHCTAVETLHCCWNFALPPKRNSLCNQPLHCVYIRAKYFPDAAEAGDDSASSDITAHCLPHHKTHAQTHSIQPFASPSLPLMRSPRLRWCGAGCIISVNSLHLTKEPQLILSTLGGVWSFIETEIFDHFGKFS